MFKHKWIKLAFFGLMGMAAGYAYYYFIGCTGNACPITSNPYLTTGYGLGVGIILGLDSKKKENSTKVE